MVIYPSTIPAIAVPIRARLLSIAGNLERNIGRVGEDFFFILYDPSGFVVFTSPWYRASDAPTEVKILVPFVRRGYKVKFVFLQRQNNHTGSYLGYIWYPFDFGFQKQKGQMLQPLIIIRIAGSPGLQIAILKGRKGARDQIPRLRKERNRNPKGAITVVAQVPTWNYTNGSGSSGSASYVAFSRSASGTVTPGYMAKKKAGTLPINAYNLTIVQDLDGGFGIDSWNTGNSSTQTQGGLYASHVGTAEFGSAPGNLPSGNTSLDFRAQRKLREKLGPSNNIAQDFAQYRQTTDLIAGNLGRLLRAGIATKQGNLSEAVNQLWGSKIPRFKDKGHKPNRRRDLADNWLMLQYGWKPLLDDIRGVIESVKRYNNANEVVYTQRASATSDSRTSSRMFLNVGGPRTYVGTQNEIRRTTFRYGIRYRIQNRLRVFLAQTGLDPTNPLSLAWEVLPFSFVADWLLPIGPFLDSLSAYNGLEFLDGWKSEINEVETFWQVGYSGKMFPSDPTDKQMVGYYGSRVRRAVGYARTRLTAFPTSPIPELKNPFTPHHALNALALVQSFFGGRH